MASRHYHSSASYAEASLKTQRTPDGRWVAWIERNGQPLTCEAGRPRLFEGPTCYQAQCRAYRWLSPEKSFLEQIRRLTQPT